MSWNPWYYDGPDWLRIVNTIQRDYIKLALEDLIRKWNIHSYIRHWWNQERTGMEYVAVGAALHPDATPLPRSHPRPGLLHIYLFVAHIVSKKGRQPLHYSGSSRSEPPCTGNAISPVSHDEDNWPPCLRAQKCAICKATLCQTTSSSSAFHVKWEHSHTTSARWSGTLYCRSANLYSFISISKWT